jgi:hypothetical protein
MGKNRDSSAEMSGEISALLNALSDPRSHVLAAIDGLGDEALRSPMFPSGWSCLGLINHLSFDVELFWFQGVVAGDPEVIAVLLGSTGSAWNVGSQLSAHDVLERYRRHTEQSNSIIASTSLDATPAWWPEDRFGSFRIDTVRGIVLHVLSETAAHAGHLDIARELIDGKQHVVQTDRSGS